MTKAVIITIVATIMILIMGWFNFIFGVAVVLLMVSDRKRKHKKTLFPLRQTDEK